MKIFVSVGTKCSIAGWGVTETGVQRPTKLRIVTVPVVDLETCRKNYMNGHEITIVTNSTICAGLSGKDSCFVSLFGILVSPTFKTDKDWFEAKMTKFFFIYEMDQNGDY